MILELGEEERERDARRAARDAHAAAADAQATDNGAPSTSRESWSVDIESESMFDQVPRQKDAGRVAIGQTPYWQAFPSLLKVAGRPIWPHLRL